MRKRSLKEKEFYFRQLYRRHRYELKRKKKRLEIKHTNLASYIKHKRSEKFIRNYKKAQHERLEAPSSLSLVEDTTSTISYFQKAEKFLAKDIPVFFDLSTVIHMGPETLTYFCALINEDNFTHGTALQGNTPNDNELKLMFNRSGFYKFVTPQVTTEDYIRDVDGEIVHRVTRQKVEAELAGKICLSAMKHTFNTEDFTKQSFYRILIECMANTWNHARYQKNEEAYNWWLLAYKDTSTKITKFCFLDLGVGIFDSLEKKYRDHNLGEWLTKLFMPTNNQETLKNIFLGERKTSTNKPERGLGLNYIYKLVTNDKTISNFTLISNDIMAKIMYNTGYKIDTITPSFKGTLYYWELTPNNEQ